MAKISRFISEKSVIKYLCGVESLPYILISTLSLKLELESDMQLEKLTRVNTKGVGGTQCRPYIMHFNNGYKYFLKLSPKSKKCC
jgi:hypothetical protein